MASKKDLRSYFQISNESKNKKNVVSIPEIIVSETNDASQAEVDMAKQQVKKQALQRKTFSGTF